MPNLSEGHACRREEHARFQSPTYQRAPHPPSAHCLGRVHPQHPARHHLQQKAIFAHARCVHHAHECTTRTAHRMYVACIGGVARCYIGRRTERAQPCLQAPAATRHAPVSRS
eukprot:224039-Prymnesium_polylepis.4